MPAPDRVALGRRRRLSEPLCSHRETGLVTVPPRLLVCLAQGSAPGRPSQDALVSCLGGWAPCGLWQRGQELRAPGPTRGRSGVSARGSENLPARRVLWGSPAHRETKRSTEAWAKPSLSASRARPAQPGPGAPRLSGSAPRPPFLSAELGSTCRPLGVGSLAFAVTAAALGRRRSARAFPGCSQQGPPCVAVSGFLVAEQRLSARGLLWFGSTGSAAVVQGRAAPRYVESPQTTIPCTSRRTLTHGAARAAPAPFRSLGHSGTQRLSLFAVATRRLRAEQRNALGVCPKLHVLLPSAALPPGG